MSGNGQHLLDLPFRGARSYLHSTDIYPALMKLTRAEFGVNAFVDSLTLRSPFACGIQVTFEAPSLTSGTFRVRHGSDCTFGWLVETKRPITNRNPTDLPSVTNCAISGPGFARLSEPLPRQAPLDVLVSLMKLVSSQVSRGHWWLCQINLDMPLIAVYPLEVRIHRNLGARCLVFNITQQHQFIGSARFMLENAVFWESIRVSTLRTVPTAEA
jgi:hypothetical protein